jgi:RNA polymerase primary sigma factor
MERTARVQAIALESYAIDSRQRFLRSPADSQANEQRRETIESVLANLSFREAEIIRLRFGMDGEPPRSYNEIADVFKVTVSRIRQIEAKAIRKMQQPSVIERLSEHT